MHKGCAAFDKGWQGFDKGSQPMRKGCEGRRCGSQVGVYPSEGPSLGSTGVIDEGAHPDP